ncbi:MAG: DUF1249 domain-containing protein [Pseudomonadota bacterium]
MSFCAQHLRRPSSRQFTRLMDLYEQNYILLRRLLGDAASLPDQAVSRAPGHLPLYLWVEERAKFTTTIRLSYRFDCTSRRHREFEPDLVVRIYHDARSGEAMSAIVNGKPRQRREAANLMWRWQLNRFLNRWLSYCLHQGHDFSGARRQVS